MSGSCNFDRASNDKFSVEFWIFVIVIVANHDRVLKFEAPSKYYKGALTQKRSFRVNWTFFRSDFNVGWKRIKTNIQNSTLNLSFHALLKWHDLHTKQKKSRISIIIFTGNFGSWGSQFWDFTRPGAVWTYFGDVYCDDPPCGKQDSHISQVLLLPQLCKHKLFRQIFNCWL